MLHSATSLNTRRWPRTTAPLDGQTLQAQWRGVPWTAAGSEQGLGTSCWASQASLSNGQWADIVVQRRPHTWAPVVPGFRCRTRQRVDGWLACDGWAWQLQKGRGQHFGAKIRVNTRLHSIALCLPMAAPMEATAYSSTHLVSRSTLTLTLEDMPCRVRAAFVSLSIPSTILPSQSSVFRFFTSLHWQLTL